MTVTGIGFNSYLSQFAPSAKGITGACFETCFIMAEAHYCGLPFYGIADVVAHGDKDPNFTSIDGAIKTAAYLGLKMEAANTNLAQVKSWLTQGFLVIPIVEYELLPDSYKYPFPKKYVGGHALLITGIADDLGGIRYCDPDFPVGNDGGFMNNNKWISAKDFSPAWAKINNLAFVIKEIKNQGGNSMPTGEQVLIADCYEKAAKFLRDTGKPEYIEPASPGNTIKRAIDHGYELFSSQGNGTYKPVGTLYEKV